MALEILTVQQGSIAAELGLEPGDALTSMNGERLVDIIDYIALSAKADISLVIQTKQGTIETVEFEKDEAEPLGLSFVGDGLGKNRGCANQCVFCFVDQLPSNMRSTLYFKDDDWRLSLIMGNYVTLTNLSEKELDRLIKRGAGPLYISVHATDDDVRAYMLGCERGRDILPILKKLAAVGISFHMQAVICPGINDGVILEKTIRDLSALMPYALSLALVPVGLSGHRDGLAKLKPMDKIAAEKIVQVAHTWQEKLLARHGTRFVFVADELYLRAEYPFPPAETYEGFPLLEDGVGLVASFLEEVQEGLQEYQGENKKTLSIATGVDAAPYIKQAAKLCKQHFGVNVHVYPIENNFFGKSITVTGLLTGQDIYMQLQNKELGESLYVCSTLLRDGNGVFLDDMPLAELAEKLHTKITVIEPDGLSFVKAFSGMKEE